MSDEMKEELGSTYGLGEQIVSEPDTPDQLIKENPKDELPRKVGFVKPGEKGEEPTGQVMDLDTGTVTTPELIEISGMRIDVEEFGEGGIFWLHTMYEQWLYAVETDQVATFREADENYVNSMLIIEEAKKHYPIHYLKMLKGRTVDDPHNPGKENNKIFERFIVWDRDTTLEQWLMWTAATLRWRINYEIDRRRITQGLSAMDVSNAKMACENCLVAAEKFLKLSERERLITV